MTAEVTRIDCLVETSEDELDLFEMDQIDPDERISLSSVEFIQNVLTRLGQDVSENKESK